MYVPKWHYPDGMIKTLSYPDANIVTSYTYDNANQITKMETKKDSEILASYSYEYDGVGNITSVSGSQLAAYTYDELNRLKTVTENGYTATYEYDNRNNIIQETRDNGYLKTYEYTGDNKLKKTVENGVETIFEYDLNGNMIKRGDDVFAYDSLNRLVYSCVDGEVSEYDIGINGLRWRKKANNHRVNYLYDDAGNLLAEDRNYFVVCNNRVLAKTIDDSYYYYIYNAHGDVVMIVDEEGNIKNTYQYDAWGSVVSQTETIANNHKYAGEYQDLDSELIYLRNRYYDPSVGRFITEDIHWNSNNMIYGDKSYEDGKIKIPDMNAIMQSSNLYSYSMNNPMKYVDSSGLWVETAFDIASFGVSVKEVWDNPKDVWNWVGLAGDAVDFIPFVAGVGEAVKGAKVTYKIADDVSDAKKIVKTSSKVTKTTKFELPGKNSKHFTKLKNGQGYKDFNGNIWKKDQLHKDHWDVIDKKGNKIREVDFNGNEIWPNGPKNKNK